MLVTVLNDVTYESRLSAICVYVVSFNSRGRGAAVHEREAASVPAAFREHR